MTLPVRSDFAPGDGGGEGSAPSGQDGDGQGSEHGVQAQRAAAGLDNFPGEDVAEPGGGSSGELRDGLPPWAAHRQAPPGVHPGHQAGDHHDGPFATVAAGEGDHVVAPGAGDLQRQVASPGEQLGVLGPEPQGRPGHPQLEPTVPRLSGSTRCGDHSSVPWYRSGTPGAVAFSTTWASEFTAPGRATRSTNRIRSRRNGSFDGAMTSRTKPRRARSWAGSGSSHVVWTLASRAAFTS